MKVGLALGGGAARGLAHVGVLMELEKAGIPIDLIVGTSIGALVGGMYAINPNADEVKGRILGFFTGKEFNLASVDFVNSTQSDEEKGLLRRVAQTVRKSIFYGISLTRLSYLSLDMLEKEVAMLVPDIEINETRLPFSCGATDITNSAVYYFHERSLRKAIVASCALPGIFPPVELYGRKFIDGSWAVQNPVACAREMGADFVIAINIDPENDEEMELRNGLDVVLVGNKVTRRMLAKMQLKEADAVVTPNTCDIHWADFGHSALCVERGSDSASKIIPEIKKKLRKARLRKFLGFS